MASQPVYIFYAELDGFKPKIWRRFQVMNNITVAKLGYILQVLFEMTASHLMAFEVPWTKNLVTYFKSNNPDLPPDHSIFQIEEKIFRYEIFSVGQYESLFDNDIRKNVEVEDAAETRLSHAVSIPESEFKFYYDFGDGWQISLILEKVLPGKDFDAKELPKVIEGANFGIVEDVGGIWGLTEFAEAYKKKKGTRYKEFCEWIGKTDFDITAFDMDDLNFRLKKLPRIYKQCYEDNLSPTQASIDLIERKYYRS